MMHLAARTDLHTMHTSKPVHVQSRRHRNGSELGVRAANTLNCLSRAISRATCVSTLDSCRVPNSTFLAALRHFKGWFATGILFDRAALPHAPLRVIRKVLACQILVARRLLAGQYHLGTGNVIGNDLKRASL
jgi:hypothetical protein